MVCPAAAAAAVRIFPARRGHQKRKEAAEPDPNPVRAVETERRRKTAGREALRRSDERRSARVGEAEGVGAPLDDKCLEATCRP